MPEQFGINGVDPRYPGPDYHPPKRGMPWWGWLIVGFVVVVALPCFGCLGWLAYIGTVGPETSVYTGNNVPSRFIDTVKDVGALEPDETILYFYSDALSDIQNGFYFVSDKRVVIYNESTGGDPLTVVGFDQIETLDLYRDTSFLTDSEVYLELKDGSTISFPLSSETGGDERFFKAIQDGVDKAGD